MCGTSVGEEVVQRRYDRTPLGDKRGDRASWSDVESGIPHRRSRGTDGPPARPAHLVSLPFLDHNTVAGGQVGVGNAVTVIDPAKIQVGIPFYGTDWPNNADPIKSRSFRACRDLIAQHNATVVYEPTRGEAHFSYTDANGVGHTVWYSDDRSVAAKAALVKQYGVHGLSVWALGYGDTELWNAIRAELKP